MKRGSRTSRTRRTKGGVVIGKGTFGEVYTKPEPSLEKLLPDGCVWKDDYVMKVVDDDKEWTRTEVLRKNAIEGAIYPESICRLKKRYALFSKNGGQSLLELFYSTGPIVTKEAMDNAKNKAIHREVVQHSDKIDAVIAALEGLKSQIQAMNEKGIYHRDIQEGNIVYDGTTAQLIDFGTMSTTGEKEDGVVDVIISRLKPKGGLRKKVGPPTRRTRRRRSYL